MSTLLSRFKLKAQVTFWRTAAKTTGFAVRHRRGLYRALTYAPLAIVALAAFILGRGLGMLLDAGLI